MKKDKKKNKPKNKDAGANRLRSASLNRPNCVAIQPWISYADCDAGSGNESSDTEWVEPKIEAMFIEDGEDDEGSEASRLRKKLTLAIFSVLLLLLSLVYRNW